MKLDYIKYCRSGLMAVALAGASICVPNVASAQTEGAEGTVSFGISHSSRYGTRGDIDLSISNILNSGIDTRVRYSNGANGQAYSAQLGIVRELGDSFLGSDTRLSFGVSGQFTDWTVDNYKAQTLAATLGVSTQLAENIRGYTTLAWRRADISNLAAGVSPILLKDLGQAESLHAELGLVYDTRENESFLSPGILGSLRAGIGLSGDASLRQSWGKVSVQSVTQLNDLIYLRVVADAGSVFADDTQHVHVLDRSFTAAGLPRGFSYGGAGPRDTSVDMALGGTKYASASGEVLFNVPIRGLSIGLFYDMGTVWDVPAAAGATILEDNFLRSSYGISLNYEFGSAILRMSYAEANKSLPSDDTNVLSIALSAKF